jgi:hypothetical protein
MTEKTASSQAAWALLTEGVTKARVEAHRLQHLLDRAVQLVDKSKEREHFYEVAGDIIQAIPMRLDALQTTLDRTSLALAKMGESFLEARLSISDKTMVNEAVQSAFGGSQMRQSESAKRVARRYLRRGVK